eukprot:jgi/Tetstr1/444113/TSEL_032012.t1
MQAARRSAWRALCAVRQPLSSSSHRPSGCACAVEAWTGLQGYLATDSDWEQPSGWAASVGGSPRCHVGSGWPDTTHMWPDGRRSYKPPPTIERAAEQADSREQPSVSTRTSEPADGDGDSVVPRPRVTWADRHAPTAVLPYIKLMRADSPIGTYLLAMPCLWSIALAGEPGALPDLYNMGLFSVGAFLLRSAGCTVNDLWDRELDAKVERTKQRPLASGAITPAAAVGALGLQLLLGLGILLQLNDYSRLLGASSLLLVGSYPLMKRVTYWPQAFLGLTINWGAMLGYAAVQGHCDWPLVLPLYAAGITWTLVYDTIYAHQDKQDDVHAGVKSTALLFGQHTKGVLAGFATLSTASLAACGAAAGAGTPFYCGVAAVAAHYAWQLGTVDLDDRADCMAKFVSNKWLGLAMTGGIVADKLLMAPLVM